MKTRKVRVEGIDVLTGKKVVEHHEVPENQHVVHTNHVLKGTVHIGVEYVSEAYRGMIKL